jgi:hypothetical protein
MAHSDTGWPFPQAVRPHEWVENSIENLTELNGSSRLPGFILDAKYGTLLLSTGNQKKHAIFSKKSVQTFWCGGIVDSGVQKIVDLFG